MSTPHSPEPDPDLARALDQAARTQRADLEAAAQAAPGPGEDELLDRFRQTALGDAPEPKPVLRGPTWLRWVSTIAAILFLAQAASTWIWTRPDKPGNDGYLQGGEGLFLPSNPVFGRVQWKSVPTAIFYKIRAWPTEQNDAAQPQGEPLDSSEAIEETSWAVNENRLPDRGGLRYELDALDSTGAIVASDTFEQQR